MKYTEIGEIPLVEREQKPFKLLFLWFSSNMQLTTIVTGALAISLHASIGSAIVGIIVGNVIGGSIMALHSAQGPRLPAPQMVMTRALFGDLGSALPTIVFALMYVGFYSTTSVIGGQVLHHFFQLPFWLSLLFINLLTILPVYAGDQFMKNVQHYLAYILLVTFSYLSFSVHLLDYRTLLPDIYSHLSVSSILTMVGVAITWQISYTPYVADYSRSLHPALPSWKLMWFSGAGTILSSTWMMGLGAIVAWRGITSDDIESAKFLLSQVSWFVKIPIEIVLVLGIITVNSFNLYGSYISYSALLLSRKKHRVNHRFLLLFVITILCTGISIWGKDNFMLKYSTFLNYLIYFLIPWSAITLVNYYRASKSDRESNLLKRIHDHYSVVWGTVIVYLTAVLFEFFVLISAHWLHWAGALSSITWMIGFISSVILYLLKMKFSTRKRLTRFL